MNPYAFRISFIYLIIGLLWIFFSDQAILWLFQPETSEGVTVIQHYKGYLFVSTTALITYFLVNYYTANLKKSENLQRKLFRSNANPMWITDSQSGKIYKANQAAKDLYGYSHKQMQNMYYDQLVLREFDGRSMLVSDDHNRLCFHQLADGRELLVEESRYPVQFKSRTAMMIMARDVTEKQRTEQKILRLNEELKEKVIERNELIQNLSLQTQNLREYTYITSHNLRAPIANILGIIEVLGLKKDDPEEFQKLIEMLDTSAANLDAIIKDLTKILEIKDKHHESREWVDLIVIIEEVKQLLSKPLEDFQASVNIETSKGTETKIFTVKSYMLSIFYNLISNAIKYRHENRQAIIDISLDQQESIYQIKVNDNGLGINLEKYGDKLFGLYKRFHFHQEGRGLGLYLVKSQVEAMGGTIAVMSEANVGTTFEISIPIKHHKRLTKKALHEDS